ncbi:uncharacterized protein LOC113471345, partial [Diaphorina citri]|uniref:Uncharacterized protein LOC113471345 n=1 Tax=Diaphorina citri TaxID=121845 RepID=A0A3Q0JGM7_DIACI
WMIHCKSLYKNLNTDLLYCPTTIPFLYLSLLDSLLPHIKIATKLCTRIITSLATCIRSVEALWSSCSRIGSQFCSNLTSVLSALCEKSNESHDSFTKVQLFLLADSLVRSLLPLSQLSLLPSHIHAWMCGQVSRPDLFYLYPALTQPWYELCASQFTQVR